MGKMGRKLKDYLGSVLDRYNNRAERTGPKVDRKPPWYRWDYRLFPDDLPEDVDFWAFVIGAAIAFAMLGLWLPGCARPGTVPGRIVHLDSAQQYHMGLDVFVNGIHGVGMLVVPSAPTYSFSVIIPHGTEELLINSCHREHRFTPAEGSFAFAITPTTVEDSGYCPIIIRAVGPEFGSISAYVDFANLTLVANITCDGYSRYSNGSSVCQARMDTYQSIKFSQAGTWSRAKRCPDISVNGPADYGFRLGRGLCVYSFKALDGQYHRLTTYGYDSFP